MGKGSNSAPVQSAGMPEWAQPMHEKLLGQASKFYQDLCLSVRAL